MAGTCKRPVIFGGLTTLIISTSTTSTPIPTYSVMYMSKLGVPTRGCHLVLV